jgi:hypothetical protein
MIKRPLGYEDWKKNAMVTEQMVISPMLVTARGKCWKTDGLALVVAEAAGESRQAINPDPQGRD